MFPHLWKSCFVLLIILLTNRQVQCNSCALSELEKVNGYCTAEINCLQEVDFDVKTWTCIQHSRYVEEYNYDYGYGRRVNRKVTTYDENFNLIIHVVNPTETISLAVYKKNCIQLIIEAGDLITIPQDILQMEHLEELNITANNIGAINLNIFLSLSSLTKINLKNNMIRVVENNELNDVTHEQKISALQSIDLSHNYIAILPNNFVSRFIQLQHLNLSHNSITNIGLLTFEGIVKLQTLDLSYNRLQDIGHAFARFSDLKKLIISHNNITKLFTHNFITLTNLEILNASSNGINFIEDNTFQLLTSLKNLDLCNNNLVTIRHQFFDNNVNLHTLFLSNNKINAIEPNSFDKTQLDEFSIQNNDLIGVLKTNTFKGVKVLKLNLSGGNLTGIDNYAFNEMSLLSDLNLSSNSIYNLSFSAFSTLVSLNVLDLSHNLLEDLNFDSKNLTQLIKLTVCNNRIEKIIKNVFENFLSLKELDLSYNNIRVIEPHSFLRLNNITLFDITNSNFVNTLESKALEGLTSLKKLDMSKTKTTIFTNGSFTGLTALINVNYTCGHLAKIEYNAFLGIGFIEKLFLSNNKLQQFSVNTSTISHVEEIYLDNNLIKNILSDTFAHLILLRVLNLANNEIVRLNSDAFQDLNALTHLDISSNEQMTIVGNPFYNLNSLYSVTLKHDKGGISFANSSASIEILDLKSCGIKEVNNVSLSNVQRLSYLNLSMNEICTIDKNSFRNITTLVSLDLSFNKITNIQPGSFINVKNLRDLNLFGNNIATIQFGVFDGIEILSDLNLSSNVLSTFDVKLIPNTTKLSLDDNIITDIDFEGFLDTDLSELSVGGNQISCKILAGFKSSKYSEKFRSVVTAKTLNFHSENVNGISCQTANNITPTKNSNVSTVPSMNVSPLVATLRNVLEKLSDSVQIISKITNYNEKLKNRDETFEKLLQDIAVSNNNSQITNNNYLHQLTEINNSSNLQLGEIKKYLMQAVDIKKDYESNGIAKVTSNTNSNDQTDYQRLRFEFQKMLKQEKDALRDEFQEALASISKSSPVQESLIAHEKGPDDSKYVIYFMAVCLAIMLSVYIGNIVFKRIINSRRSSISQITNSIEME